MKYVRSRENELRWEAKRNAITCAWVIPAEFLCYHQRKYFYKWQKGQIAWFILTQHENLSKSTPKQSPKSYKTSALLPPNSEHFYPSRLLNLKPLNRKRRIGCLCKLSAKSQSQTHLRRPDRHSAFNFLMLRLPATETLCHFSSNAMCKGLFNDSVSEWPFGHHWSTPWWVEPAAMMKGESHRLGKQQNTAQKRI